MSLRQCAKFLPPMQWLETNTQDIFCLGGTVCYCRPCFTPNLACRHKHTKQVTCMIVAVQVWSLVYEGLRTRVV